MSRLTIRVDAWWDGPGADRGVPVSVRRLAPGASRLLRVESVEQIVVPMGPGDAVASIDAKPGRYLVEAPLPSGEILAEEIEVLPVAETVPVRLQAESSPHEWLGWQHLYGNVEDLPIYESRRLTRAESLGVADYDGDPTCAWLGAPGPTFAGADAAGVGAWEVIDRLIREQTSMESVVQTIAEDQSAQIETMAPAIDDGMVCVYEFDYGRPVSSAGTGPVGNRAYALIEYRDSLQLVTLPLPWTSVDTGNEVRVQVMLRMAGSAPSAGVGVVVCDPALGVALGYMTAGKLESASVLFNHARDMLYQKMSNPLAAAAGAYVLLATAEDGRDAEWHDWIWNLKEWFSWLPDGAILHATLLLNRAETDEDFAKAGQALLEAYRRGLPVYSAGIDRLLHGLTLLADEYDGIAEAARRVQRVAFRVNMDQAFTIVTLRR